MILVARLRRRAVVQPHDGRRVLREAFVGRRVRQQQVLERQDDVVVAHEIRAQPMAVLENIEHRRRLDERLFRLSGGRLSGGRSGGGGGGGGGDGTGARLWAGCGGHFWCLHLCRSGLNLHGRLFRCLRCAHLNRRDGVDGRGAGRRLTAGGRRWTAASAHHTKTCRTNRLS